jgi:hypothetical protein
MAKDPAAVVHRLAAAQNNRDIDAFVACFADDYHSEQPIHPSRTFDGAAQVRRNWTAVFAAMPDFRADLVRWSVTDSTVWSEWDWTGSRADGPFHQRGVIILGVHENRIAWARLYLEDVDDTGETIDEQVRRMSGEAP